MLLSSRCNVFVVDDEGFEEIVFYGFMIKLVFVYLCLLFDDVVFCSMWLLGKFIIFVVFKFFL